MDGESKAQCAYNGRVHGIEHHFRKDDEGKWVCTRCGETNDPERPFGMPAGQIGKERRT